MIRSAANLFPLFMQLVRRDIAARYRGSILGLCWSMLHPLLMLGVYGFVFTVVFQARWHQESPALKGTSGEFVLLLFAGLILHGFLSEILGRAPQLVVSNPNFVKRVVFPLEFLAPVLVASALFQASIGFVILAISQIMIFGFIPWTIILAPLVLLPLVIMALGTAWVLSALGVYLRDIAQLMGVFSTVLLFISPIFYPASTLPDIVRPYIYLNPLSLPVEELRKVAIYGLWPDWLALSLYTVIALGIAWAGFAGFKKSRRGFADVL